MIFGLLTPFAVFAQSNKNDVSSQADLISDFEVNGLKVILKRRPGISTVAAGLFFRGGVGNLSAENAGIESFMLSVATEGSQKYPREALRRELANTGSSFGAGSNYDFSVLELASTRQSFDRTWDAFVDIALHPTFANEDVELTRGKYLSGLLEAESDPDNFLQSTVNKTIFSNTSYKNDPNGTVATISSFSQSDLKAYHQKVMQTSRLLLVIVGDFQVNELKGLVESSFGKLPKGDYILPAPPVFNFAKPSLTIAERELPTNYVQGVFSAPSLSDPDYYAMQVAVTLVQGRIFQEVRVKRSLSYAPSAKLNSTAANTANVYVSAVDANKSVEVILDEIKKMKSGLIGEDLIESLSGHFLPLYYLDQETSGAQAGELAKYELLGGGWQNSVRFIDGIRSVTPEQIRAVSAKYMKNLQFVVVGDLKAIDRTIFLQNP